MTPSFRLEGERNDNFSLTTLPHTSVTGTLVSPRIDLGVQAPVWQINGSAEFVRQSYSDRSSLGRDSQQYRLFSKYMTERTTWSLGGSRSYAPMLVGNVLDPDVGISQLRKERKSSGYAPAWAWTMTERTQLQLGYQNSDITYEDGQIFSLFDYTTRGITASLSNQLSFLTSISINLGYSIFEVPANGFESKSASLNGGLSHSFSDTLKGSFSVGAQKTQSEGIIKDCILKNTTGVNLVSPTGEIIPPGGCVQFSNVPTIQDQTSTLMGASIDKQFDVTRFSVNFNRSIVPSGSGILVQTDVLNFQASRLFSPSLTGSLSAGIYDISSSFGAASGADRRLIYVNPGLSWQLTQRWKLESSFRYNVLKSENDPNDAVGRAVSLNFSYQGSRVSISR